MDPGQETCLTPFLLVMFKVYGWPRRCLSEWPVSLSLSFLCIREPELCLWNVGILLSSPFHGPSLSRHMLWPAARDSGRGGIPWSISAAVWVPNRSGLLGGQSSSCSLFLQCHELLQIKNKAACFCSFWNSFKRPLEMLVGILSAWVFSALNFFFKLNLLFWERVSHAGIINNTETQCTFIQLPPVVTSCKVVIQYHYQDININTVKIQDIGTHGWTLRALCLVKWARGRQILYDLS